MNRICVYTCITGNYDNLKDVKKETGIDYICFTNNKYLSSNTWEIIQLNNDDCLDNLTLARKQKILIPDYIRDNYEISVWIDGAVIIKGSIKDFIEKKCNLNKMSLACFRHCQRDCIYEEAAAIIKFKKDNLKNVKKIIDYLRKDNYPKNYGLNETTILVRKHNDSTLDDMLNLWYDLVSGFCRRDQLSFNYCVKKTGLIFENIDGVVFDNEWFKWEAHSKESRLKSIRIFYGEYRNIYKDVFEDIIVEENDGVYLLQTVVVKQTNLLIINMGQHFGRRLNIVNIDDFNSVDIFPCIDIKPEKILLYDDVFIYIKGDFKPDQRVKLILKLDYMINDQDQEILNKVLNQYHYAKFERDNIINWLNHVKDDLQEKLDAEREHNEYIEKQLNFFESSFICKLYRKLKKIIFRKK